METDPTTKALQDIAAQLKRIADYMEQHPEKVYNIEVENGNGIQDGGENIFQTTESGLINNGDVGNDLNDAGNNISIEKYSSHGERGTTAKNIDILDNSSRSGGDNARRIISDNTESFNANADTAIKNLASAVSSAHDAPGNE